MSVTYFVKFSSSWAEYHICPYNEWPLYFLWYMPGLQIVNFDPWWLSTEGCFLILVIVIIWPLFSLYYNWYWCVLLIASSNMVSSDALTTNYPGKIPPGLDLPSDAVDGKLMKTAGQDWNTKEGFFCQLRSWWRDLIGYCIFFTSFCFLI